MTLDQYMTDNAITGVQLAAALEISEASLTRIRRGEQNISRDLIRRIVQATGGVVTAEDLVFHSPSHHGGITPAADGGATGKAGELSGDPAAQVAA